MYESANYIHLKRLFALRNIAIAGYFVAILVTQYALDIELPLFAAGLIVLQVVIFNSFVLIRLRQTKRVTENEIFIHLAFDVLTLALLLYFTGGATNPFVMLFLFPLTITVTILPVRYAWLLVALTVISYSLLMFNYQPLPMGHDMGHGMEHSMHGQSVSSEYDLHLTGMWLAFILNACLITYFVYGMGNTIRRQQKQLSTAREQSIRDEQLVTLGTLAASTAHELGTPLGTMSLLVNELEEEIVEPNNQISNDLFNLKQQISRCKSSLSDLSASVGASSDLYGGDTRQAGEYFEALKEEIKSLWEHANLRISWDELDTQCYLFTDRSLSLALINIIENALDVSPDFVKWIISSDQNNITIEVLDHGPGLSKKALEMIGQKPYSEKSLGLGLGLYLAYAAIRRSGGTIVHSNRQLEGCRVVITLPLKVNV